MSESGHQPMSVMDGKIWISYNGEIYNYLELREELVLAGYRFITRSDTEVLLYAYHYWGNECLQKLNGMFAFAIYDVEKQTIFCARDRSGVKPFYYYFKDGVFCFASEIKALRVLPFINTALNERAVQHYLLHDAIECEPEGFLKNIFELFPSHELELDLREKKISQRSYFDVALNVSVEPFNEETFLVLREETEQLVYHAIHQRLRADVPVGCCLSGGIDSSIISGVMAKQLTSINAFTAIFPNELMDESAYAKDVVDFTKASWNTVSPNADELIRDFDQLIYALDIPIWSTSTYAQFRVMQLVKNSGLKVVLDGQGSDEIFAGYPHYYTTFINELLRAKHFKQAAAEIKNLGNHFWLRYTKDNAKKTLHYNGNKKLLHADFVRTYDPPETTQRRINHLNGHLYLDFFNGRLKTYLRCEDRCSMYHSVESRTPFADDTSLMQFSFGLPSVYKIHQGISKYILRESMKKYIPSSVYNRRDKIGFATPHNKWFVQLMGEKQELLHSSRIRPFFADRFFVKTDHLTKNHDHLKNTSYLKENTLNFKALVLARWIELMKI